MRPTAEGPIDVGALRLGVEDHGDGPTLLFIHGFPLDRTLWAHQVAALAGWRRVAPDLRGFGSTVAPEGGRRIATYADDLVALLDRLGVRRAVVVGLSMGGYVAFDLVRRHRDRVAGLILMDTRAEADGSDARMARDQLIALARSEGVRAVGERMLPRLVGHSTRQTAPRLVERVREMIMRASLTGVLAALEAMRDREDATTVLGDIDVPTLVVVGEEDELTPPAVARRMADGIRSAGMTLVPGAGHLAPLESPAAVTRACAEFLASIREQVA